MSGSASLPHVVIVAAFHESDHELAGRLIASVLGQADVRSNVVAVLDGAPTANDASLAALLADQRITTLAVPEAKGVRGAFAAGLDHALSLYPDPATCFAYADQDDVWHPGKLEQLIRVLKKSGASLVHCDARVIARDGTLIAPSLHAFENRRNARNLIETMLLNSVSGMSSLFTSATARLSVRLMAGIESSLLHDHVTAIAASAIGGTEWLADALVDYVQHDGNVLGAREPAGRKLHQRSPAWDDIAAYRKTSQRIFQDRRAVAMALEEAGMLPGALAEMFVVGKSSPSKRRLIWRYDVAMAKMFLGGQARRGALCFRLLDAALRWRGELSASA